METSRSSPTRSSIFECCTLQPVPQLHLPLYLPGKGGIGSFCGFRFRKSLNIRTSSSILPSYLRLRSIVPHVVHRSSRAWFLPSSAFLTSKLKNRRPSRSIQASGLVRDRSPPRRSPVSRKCGPAYVSWCLCTGRCIRTTRTSPSMSLLRRRELGPAQPRWCRYEFLISPSHRRSRTASKNRKGPNLQSLQRLRKFRSRRRHPVGKSELLSEFSLLRRKTGSSRSKVPTHRRIRCCHLQCCRLLLLPLLVFQDKHPTSFLISFQHRTMLSRRTIRSTQAWRSRLVLSKLLFLRCPLLRIGKQKSCFLHHFRK